MNGFLKNFPEFLLNMPACWYNLNNVNFLGKLIKQKVLNRRQEDDSRDLNPIYQGQLGRNQFFHKGKQMQRTRVYIQKLQLKRYGVRDLMEIKIIKYFF